jgi:hypothetical protein
MRKVLLSPRLGRSAAAPVRPLLCAALLLGAFSLAFPVPSAWALRCGNRIVDVGDSKFDVLVRCGEPAAIEPRSEELTERAGEGRTRSLIIQTEEWIYNFGPTQFLSVLTFREERLVHIETRGYGFLEGAPRGSFCADEIFAIGDTKFEVLASCGEPAYHSVREEELTTPFDSLRRRRVILRTEEWVYNFGPLRFTRILTFRDGRLAAVRTGDWGF